MASSSATPEQLIDKIIMTKADHTNFNLTEFVKQLDELIARYGSHLRRRNRVRETLDELPSASDASNFAEQVSTNVKQIANQIKECSRNKHETSIAVLNSIGNVHWVTVGFLVVGASLKIVDTINNNKEERFRLLKSMNDLAKVILHLQPLPSLNMNLKTKLKESINLIVEGAILCCSQKKEKKLMKRMWKASTDGQELQRLNRDIDDMREKLHLEISASMLEALQVFSPPPFPFLDSDAVGIEEKIKEVIQQLDLDTDNATGAVIVYGIGGSGKTTLADAVYASLGAKLHSGRWKHSRVTLIQNLESNPNIEELQSLILQDFTATKQGVRDFKSRRQSLKDILEKEFVFLYIDNALFWEPLEKLLPKDVRIAKKFRLLLTTRVTTISGVMKACGVNPCKLYPLEPLSIDASLQVLCRKIDINRETNSIVEERPQAKNIAKECNSCPLFLEVIGAYLHQRNNEVEAYERVLKWLQSGEDFCGSQNFSFDEKRVLFSYEGLRPNAQEAFLDICSFFYDGWKWDWETLACIVGDEEMKCLEEGALIKRQDKKIKIHDLILAAGRIKSKQSRLQTIENFSLTLKNKEQVYEVKGVWMDNSNTPRTISAEELDATKRSLRVFYVGRSASVKGKCREHFEQLRFLHVETQLPNFALSVFEFQQLRYLSINGVKEDIILSPSMNLPNLNMLKFRECRIHGIAEIGHLRSLKQLDLSRCNTDGISQCFSNLHYLRRLRLSECNDLKELPESLCKLRCLEELDLRDCSNLKRLPAGFGELVSLTVLDLSRCSSLQELPCDLENLPSLQSLNISGCSSLRCLSVGLENSTSLTSLNIQGCQSLTCLPHSLEGCMLVWRSGINFNCCSSLIELPEEICKHAMVTNISLHGCSSLKMLPSRFGKLSCLQYLDLSWCDSLQELSNDFHCLVGLKRLNLSNSKSFSRLPLGFGNLSSLEDLDLSGCDKLEELCSDFHCLVGLKRLNLSNSKSLSSLPLGFGKLSSLEGLDLSECDKLEELCSDFHCLVGLKRLNLSNSKSLSSLPLGFGRLTSLEGLDLSECDKLEKLCSDFHCLVGLKRLNLGNSKSLSSLPLGFGKLRSLEGLNLSECDKLEESCGDFHCLVALRNLKLSRCDSLSKLPDRFGELSCLESLHLSGCSNLLSLSDDFHFLQSLTRLDLSNCENLGGEWIDSAGSMRSLWRLDIVNNKRMIERWMKTKSQKERNLLVVTDIPQNEKGERALLLEVVLSKVFDEEGLLLDAHQVSFHSSSLPLHTPLIFIIDSQYRFDHEKWKTLEKNLHQLQLTSKGLQIIYVGNYYNSIQSELPIRFLAYTPDNSRTSSFYHKLYSVVDLGLRLGSGSKFAVFRSTDELEQKGLKCLSAWEDISYILDPVAFLVNTPRESNIELLTELLVTEKTDYLLLTENHKVKIADQEGKIILLLVTYVDENHVSASAVKEMYVKMQEQHYNHLFQVVWVPIPKYGTSWEELERAAANAPWPRVPNPWLVHNRIRSIVGYKRPRVCVVDEKGRISNKDALATIDRWGQEAFPFSEGREEELWKAEWEAFKFNSLSTFQFIFQNMEFITKRAKEKTLVCVGRPEKMKELFTDLNRALTMLEIDFHVVYVARSHILYGNYDEMAWQKVIKEIKESEMCSMATLPLCDVYKFWHRVKRLQNDLMSGMGREERIVKMRRMVLALASADRPWIRILVVDGNGEMVSGRGMEMVELLCDGEEDSKLKFVEEIKNGGFERSVESRWRDCGIIHPKHYPQHLLQRIPNTGITCCSLCGLNKAGIIYQCNVCGKYGICRKCSNSGV